MKKIKLQNKLGENVETAFGNRDIRVRQKELFKLLSCSRVGIVFIKAAEGRERERETKEERKEGEF